MSKTVIAILALMTGGLAGSIFTWYMNHPRPTVVTYNVVSTSTGADATTQGLVPNLKLRIGDEDVGVIYTHTLDMVVQSGPQVDSATVAVKFPTNNCRIFGLAAQPPSPLHHMNCNKMSYGVQCDIGPLTPGPHAKYQLSIATDQSHPDEVLTIANKVEFTKLDDYLGKDSKSLPRNWPELTLMGITTVMLMFAIWSVMDVLIKVRGLKLRSSDKQTPGSTP